MRKLFMYNMVSVDGFFAGEDGNIDWHVADNEFDDFAVAYNTKVHNVDTVLFGRTTYELFASYWPVSLKDPKTSPAERELAQIIENLEKHVFSSSLEKVSWNKSVLHKDLDQTFIKELKAKEGGDIVIWGSGTICSQLAKANLIDEYAFMINPVILGKGRSLFPEMTQYMQLDLISSKAYKSGNILVTYHPSK